MDTRIRTAALQGIEGVEVLVEVDLSRGLPGFHLVGLPGTEVRESRDRVLSALRNSGCRAPAEKITINLAPAGLRKEGAAFDLAMALGIVIAASRVRGEEAVGRLQRTSFMGELSLFGGVRPVRGLLAMVMASVAQGCDTVLVPAEQLAEAALVPGVEVLGVRDLREAVAWWVHGHRPPSPAPEDRSLEDDDGHRRKETRLKDLVQGLRGMPLLRTAALVALVGRHNLMLVGPPGTGKTRLARALGDLQPLLDDAQALEVTRIHSARGTLRHPGLTRERPFRAPHHTISRVGLVGGGGDLAPGEATLAHHGILFLDELAEFPRQVLDALREPLEEGWIHLVRGRGRRSYPAGFQLVAAMNPCRCGLLGTAAGKCRCTLAEVARYRGRLPGPLLDRFDIFMEVARWQGDFLAENAEGAEVVERVQADWRRSPDLAMLQEVAGRIGAAVRPGGLPLAPAARHHLEWARRNLGLSLRGVHRCLAVAGTIARLDAAQERGVERSEVAIILRKHVVEALDFRQIPWQGQGLG